MLLRIGRKPTKVAATAVLVCVFAFVAVVILDDVAPHSHCLCNVCHIIHHMPLPAAVPVADAAPLLSSEWTFAPTEDATPSAPRFCGYVTRPPPLS